MGRQSSESARFVVGIDLGTTNTVVAFAPREGTTAPRVFEIAGLVARDEVEARPLLPSFLYAPLEGEAASDPWGDAPWVVGELARLRGADVPHRLVASSKSWLSYARVDRTAPVLPWGADEEAARDVPRISPVEAAARVLAHVARAWDDEHPGDALAKQDVVLTVPASFDDAARELTLEAAERAGLDVRLLEEPQAAFYDFLNRVPEARVRELVERSGGRALVLVCDVGGGTTDLSLLSIELGNERAFEIERVAVGRHLLLGGDNMDLALAHAVEARLGQKLDASRFSALTMACRAGKERLLAKEGDASVPIRLLAKGSSLIGSTIATSLTREEAERVVLDGFFPAAARDAAPARGKGALLAFGLPFERDAAITRHVAQFFAKHAPHALRPDAVLLNGGVFLAARIEARLVEVLESWGGERVDVLPHADPDLAVARGAARYALARLGVGHRIESGAARGYYLGLPRANDGARDLVCIVPRGGKEGVAFRAEGRTFALTVGRPVRFDLFASDEATHRPGDVTALDADTFDAMPPALVAFEGDAKGREIEVDLEGELSPLGTLDLACVATQDAERRFRVAFELREGASPKSSIPPSIARGARGPQSISVRDLAAERRAIETAQLARAREAVERAFGKKADDAPARAAKDLVRDLEKLLGERASWTSDLSRAIADVLLSNARARKRSPDHERVFWMLAGYCLRPGFGDANDASRIAAVAPLFDEKLAFANEVRGHQQFWIAWRRIAGGLDEATQTRMRDVADPFLAPAEKRLKKPKGWKGESPTDLLELASSLERVAPLRRSELGGWVLERTWTDRSPALWAAIGRIGAREPAYASPHHVVSPIAAERWIEHLLREKWTAREHQLAAMSLARMTGDRARDVSDAARAEVAKRLDQAGAPGAWSKKVREAVSNEEADERELFGESLPVGLRLVR